jgi:hypothetical protein
MPKRITLFVAGTFVSLLAAFALTTLSGRAVRAAECITEPNADSPQGSHWYYHLDRASNRKCWNLKPQGPNQVALPVPLPSPRPISQPTADRPAELPATKTLDGATAGENTQGSTSSTSRIVQPKPVGSIDREPASMNNRDAGERSKTDLQDQVPLITPAVTPAAAEHVPESTVIAPLACALALAAILGGAIFQHSAARRRGRRDIFERRGSGSSGPPPRELGQRGTIRTAPLAPKGVPPSFADTVATTRHAEIVGRPPEPSDLEIEETLRQFLRAWERTAA